MKSPLQRSMKIQGLFRASCYLLALSLFPALGAQAQPVRGVPGDFWADVVLGQPNFGSLSYNQVTASSVFLPSGMAADPNPAHHRLYVWDAGNSRILGFSDTTKLTPNPAANQLGFSADIVIGQTDFTHVGSNGTAYDSNDQVWPAYSAPTQTSLSGMWQRQGSITEGGSGSAMAVDPATGDLYVADIFNNRVLRFAFGDLSSGAAGPAASGLWGQTNYTSFLYNQGSTSPTDSTLGFGGTAVSSLITGCTDATSGGAYGGVGFDGQHNLWVADTGNNRVLRFPASGAGLPQNTADLVLGQSGFNATSTDNMASPIAVRVDANGNVYVMDLTAGGRILVYNAKSLAGQSAVPAPDLVYTGNLSQPWGIDMDASNNLWVANQSGGLGSGNVIAFQPVYDGSGSATGFNPAKVLMQDTVPPSGGSVAESGPDFSYLDGNPTASAFIQGPQYVVVGGDGNVFVSAKGPVENVFRFPGPIPTPSTGHATSADVEVFKQVLPGAWNQLGLNGLNQVFGVAAAQDTAGPQIIVADSYRLDFWNIPNGPQGLSNGQAPDGFAGVNSASVTLPSQNLFTRIRADHSTGATGSQHLWAVSNEFTAQVYNLPLANYASPSASLNTNIPVLGAPSSLVDWTAVGGLSGMNDVMPCGSISAPYAGGPVSYLWVADNFHSRVFRVRDPLGKLGLGPVVDILIGQTSAANNTCGNFGTWTWPNCNGSVTPNQYTLNWPGSMTLDHAGNLFICDFSLETAGNWRFLEYPESQIALATQNSLSTGQIQFLSNSASYSGAAHIYGDTGHLNDGGCNFAVIPDLSEYLCMPLQAAFSSGDEDMVVAGFERVPVVVPDPLHNFDPGTAGEPAWNHLNDFHSNMYSETFDNQNNLYTVDNNRARVLVYFNPLSIPSTPTLTILPTFTATPTATSTTTPTATKRPTLTATPTARYTATATATPCGVVFDSTTDTSVTGTSATFSHTVSGTNTLLLVQVCIEANGAKDTVKSVTYNGTALTPVLRDHDTSGSGRGDLEAWRLVNPALGTHNVVVTINDATPQVLHVGALSYKGVNQASPIGASSSVNQPSNTSHGLSLMTTAMNSLLVSMCTSYSTGVEITPGIRQIQKWLKTDNNETEGDDKPAPNKGSNTLSYTLSSSHSADILAVEVKAANTSCAPMGAEAPLSGPGEEAVSMEETITPTPTPIPTLGSHRDNWTVVAAPNVSHNGQPVQFRVNLEKPSEIQLSLFSVSGEKAFETSIQGNAGLNTISWNLSNSSASPVASGLYFYQVQAGSDGGQALKIGKVAVLH